MTAYPSAMAHDLSDIDTIEALMQASARTRQPLSYSEALAALGHPFTRPRMRALCRALDEVDARAAARSQPELAVLVVRASDGLPGQGWWLARTDWQGPWVGPAAQALVRRLQLRAFDYWHIRP
jgi:hypothetical protein